LEKIVGIWTHAGKVRKSKILTLWDSISFFSSDSEEVTSFMIRNYLLNHIMLYDVLTI
jgi:hypothetical protein